MAIETRQTLIHLIHTALSEQPLVYAAWLEGADAAGRADDYSDIDLWADVKPGFEVQVFADIKAALLGLGPLDVAQDARHPHPQLEQRFYRLADTSPFWFVDVCLQQHGRETVFGPRDPFLILFDRSGVIRTAETQLDRADIERAVQALKDAWWRRVLVLKEVNRGRLLEALRYYHTEVLDPLTEFFRLQYCPAKRGYGLKHSYTDLPREVTEGLEALYRVVTLDALPGAVEQAELLFRTGLEAFDSTNPPHPGRVQ